MQHTSVESTGDGEPIHADISGITDAVPEGEESGRGGEAERYRAFVVHGGAGFGYYLRGPECIGISWNIVVPVGDRSLRDFVGHYDSRCDLQETASLSLFVF